MRAQVAIVALGFAAACVEMPERASTDQSVAEGAAPIFVLTLEESRDLTPDGDIDPCDCPTQTCVHDWVEENFGCGICVTLVCGALDRHACVNCSPDLPPGTVDRDPRETSPRPDIVLDD